MTGWISMIHFLLLGLYRTGFSGLPVLADVDPGCKSRILLQFGDRKPDPAVAASAGGKHGREAFQGDIEVNRHLLTDAERTDAAHGMADQCLHFIRREHLCLGPELSLVFRIVDLRIARRDNQDRLAVDRERERLCNPAGFASQRLRRQFHRGAGHVKLPDPVRYSILREEFLYRFDRHNDFRSFR